MNTEYRHIAHTYRSIRFPLMQPLALSLLPLLTAVLLLTGCASSDEDSKQHAVLSIYVYTPDNPIPTRSGINPIEGETEVNSLQIWVFSHEDGRFVGYLNPSDKPSEASDGVVGAVYQMLVPDWFTVQKPLVDVYVVANAASLGLYQDFSASTSQEVLENAIMTTPFGVDPATTTIPAGGLPMTGVLREQPVVGDAPTLRIGDYDNMAKVQLTRMVSKVRFVFCTIEGTDQLDITGITINGNTFPTGEHLFLRYNTYRIDNSAYLSPEVATSLPSAEITDVKKAADPTVYVYKGSDYSAGEEAKEYEKLIDKGVNGVAEVNNGEPTLSQSGPYYFRETDKKVSGTISYKINSGDVQQATFEMTDDLGFARNHSWIVYAYYEGASGFNVISTYVIPWTNVTVNHTVYNW